MGKRFRSVKIWVAMSLRRLARVEAPELLTVIESRCYSAPTCCGINECIYSAIGF